MIALVVDDSESVRRMLSQVLLEQHCTVIEAENGIDALEILSPDSPPHVAFVDRQMPRMDGLEFVTAVRADARYNAMRIVLCSSPLSASETSALPPAAIDCFLPKPLARDGIAKVIRQLDFVA